MDSANLLLWRDFERDLMTLNRSPRTIQSYFETLDQLAAFHDGADLAGLGKEQVQDYLLDVLAKHSAATAQVRFRSLRRFYNWAVSEEIIDASPMRTMKMPEGEQKPVAVPEIEDVRALLAACEGKRFDEVRDTAIIRLFCEPGAPRCAEMAAMQVEHVDMTQDVVTIIGKGRKWRAVPFGAKTGKALSRYMRARAKHPLADSPFLWLGSRQKPLTSSGLYQMIERRCEQAGIARIHPHQLRHFATDQWYAAGGDVQDAMRLFGWSSPAMAHHYAAEHAGRRAVDRHRALQVGDRL